MKILFVASAYHRAEAFASVCSAFERMGHTVTYYPVYMKSWEHGCAATKGKEMPDAARSREGLPHVWNEVLQLGLAHDVAVLWKAEGLPPGVVKDLSSIIRTAYYSWDDPYQIEVDKAEPARGAACHLTATCCEKSMGDYAKAGAKKTIWLAPGHDPAVHHEEGLPVVDVCFVATNTYCKEIYGKGSNPPFDRRDIIRAVLEVTKSVELWGQGREVLGWIHDQHGDPTFLPYYKGFIKFEEARRAFSRARVCLNSHVRRTGRSYFNERTFQILGCRRPMLIDDNPGTKEVLRDAALTYGSMAELKANLKRLLANQDEREALANRAKAFSHDFTWDRFCQRLLEALP